MHLKRIVGYTQLRTVYIGIHVNISWVTPDTHLTGDIEYSISQITPDTHLTVDIRHTTHIQITSYRHLTGNIPSASMVMSIDRYSSGFTDNTGHTSHR